MKKLLIASVALTALAFVATDSAQAGHRSSGFRLSIGSCGTSFGYGSGYFGNYRRSYNSHYGRGYGFSRGGYGSRGWYHDTSHWDYHPGGFVRHGNHYDYIPGHYDYHRTGHWHH